MTEEQVGQCLRVTVAVMSTSAHVAFMTESSREMVTALRVALFICEEYIAHPEAKPDDYTAVIREMIEHELGIK